MTPPVEEDEVLERIRGMVGNGIEGFGLRDDAAVLQFAPGRPLLASVDSVVEGVHVDLSLCSPGDVGWKALMGALSDLAAMGATPLGALELSFGRSLLAAITVAVLTRRQPRRTCR